MGGEQSRFDAQHQREECLTTVVMNLFSQMGYTCTEQPEYIGELSPDILAENDTQKIVIELKAYHRKMVCAEPEFAQAIRYAQAARDNAFAGKVRVLLITSGSMVPSYQCGFYCGGDPVEHTIVRYSQLLEELKQEHGLDVWDAKGIYKRAEEKVRKATWTTSELPAVDIKTLEDLQVFLETDERPVLLGCVHPTAIKDSLKKFELEYEIGAFKRLETTPLRVLMQHPGILNCRRQQVQ